MKFNFNLPVNLIFGVGRAKEVGNIVSEYGKKALIVTGGSSTKKSGLLDRTVACLKTEGIDSVVFDKVRPNPLTTTAQEGAMYAKSQKCDVVVGLGGGSIMDCAKAIAFIAVNNGDINDYIFGRKSSNKALPLVLIPTTCGTGSEGNGFAVLTNPDSGDKKSLRCNGIIAKASIVDPECMMTMPKSVLASVGFDTLCHCMEAYVSKISQPITDMYALQGMKLIGDNLVKIYEGSEDINSWEAITLASTLGGMVINCAGVALPHGMEHPASGLKDIVHGKGLAALTPVIMERSIEGNINKFAAISRCLGGRNEKDCVDSVRMLLKKLDLDINLGNLGISKEDVDWMTENCIKVSAASIANHPVTFSKEQIRDMYIEAII